MIILPILLSCALGYFTLRLIVRDALHPSSALLAFTGSALGLGIDLPFAAGQDNAETGEDLKEAMRVFERQHILSSLQRHDYDKVETARRLGIGVSSLYRKLDELGIAKTQEGEDAPPATPDDPA